MRDIVDIDSNRPHTVSELICLRCYKRWIAVYPTYSNLINFQCPKCGEVGFVINTGQEINFEEIEVDSNLS